MTQAPQAYTLQPIQDILYVDLFGSWNHDQTYNYSLDYKKQVSRYFAREWVCVMNLQQLDMLISEQAQIETFRALNTWSYIKGMTAMLVVIGIENRHHLLYQFEDIFDDKQPYEKAILYSDAEAQHWLIEHGKISKPMLRTQKSA